MRKVYLLIAFIAFANSYSQEVYFLTGSNFTKYNFSSDKGSMSTPLQGGTGSTYEMGYSRPLKNNRFSHTIGVNLNEYNAVAGNMANRFERATHNMPNIRR